MELALDAAGLYGHGVPPIVSILVFVELALDVLRDAGMVPAIDGFNPCFRGTCS